MCRLKLPLFFVIVVKVRLTRETSGFPERNHPFFLSPHSPHHRADGRLRVCAFAVVVPPSVCTEQRLDTCPPLCRVQRAAGGVPNPVRGVLNGVRTSAGEEVPRSVKKVIPKVQGNRTFGWSFVCRKADPTQNSRAAPSKSDRGRPAVLSLAKCDPLILCGSFRRACSHRNRFHVCASIGTTWYHHQLPEQISCKWWLRPQSECSSGGSE